MADAQQPPQQGQKPVEVEDFDMTATEGFELVKIDEGVYDAELSKLVKIPNVKVVRNNVEQIVDMLRWVFTTPDGIEIGGTSSTKFGPQSKANKWVTKLLGHEIETGTTMKPKELVGKACQIVVKDKTKERIFNNQKQTQVYSVVNDVLAPKKVESEKPKLESPKTTKKEKK